MTTLAEVQDREMVEQLEQTLDNPSVTEYQSALLLWMARKSGMIDFKGAGELCHKYGIAKQYWPDLNICYD